MNCYSHASSLQAVFAVALGPFTFFNVQKTKYLQLFTTVTRWLGKMKKHTCYILSVTVLMPYIFKLLILQRNLATKIWYFEKTFLISESWKSLSPVNSTHQVYAKIISCTLKVIFYSTCIIYYFDVKPSFNLLIANFG